jgi:phosphatidylserine decarboxylase
LRIAREGWSIILAMAAATLLCAAAGWLAAVWLGAVLGIAGAILTGWAVWFFRDPDRVTPAPPTGQEFIISPADGHVIRVDEAPLPVEIRGPGAASPRRRVAIFLNIFDVHVNRVPAPGKVVRVGYVPGKFFNASLDKASEHNERSAALMVDPEGREIGFVQIAGLIAWRIVNHLREGQQVTAGERFGLIRFGSRAEVYFPPDAEILVKEKQYVRAGETVLAVMPARSTVAAPAPVPAGAPGVAIPAEAPR